MRGIVRVPGQSSSVELVTIDPFDLQAAQDRDAKFAELTSVRAQTADLTLKRNHPGAGALA